MTNKVIISIVITFVVSVIISEIVIYFIFLPYHLDNIYKLYFKLMMLINIVNTILILSLIILILKMNLLSI